jgi:hypothetical protein
VAAWRRRLSARVLIVPLAVLVGAGVRLLVAPAAQSSRGSPARGGGSAPGSAGLPSDSRDNQAAALPAPAKGIGKPRARRLTREAHIAKWAPVRRADRLEPGSALGGWTFVVGTPVTIQ